ncbi:MAG: DNA-processing protein DprA [Patescibacteria group bacterium]
MKLLSEIPPALREIPQPPVKLYIEGALPDPDTHIYVSFVGSRRISSYGKEACEKIIAGLAGYPFVIVSGLAIGADSVAHRAALRTKLPTIAVPGSGIDPKVIYPSQNRELAREIVQSGGALLSEFEPTFRATPWSFPQRNRIMAGLCRGVVIIEASEKSGTLITARLALDYNRDVFALPGSIFSENSIGPHRLLSQGAAPITSADDLIRAYDLLPETQTTLPLKNLLPIEYTVLEILSVPMTRDFVLEELALPISEANGILAMMEIKGLIRESMGELRRG